MQTITVVIQGQIENLKDASMLGVHFASTKRIQGDKLTASFICETEDREQALQETMECINLQELERCECDLLSIG